MGMPEFASIDLDGFRFRNDDGNESSAGASFKAAENTNLTSQSVDSDYDVRVRILLEQDNAAHDQGDSTTPRLDAKLNTGSFAAVPNSGAGSFVEMVASQLVDGNDTTDHGLTKTTIHLHETGKQEETSATATAITWANGQLGSSFYEWSVRLLSAGLANGDEVFFRVTNAGTALDTYTFGDLTDTNPIKIGVTKTAAAGPPVGGLMTLGVGR